MRLGVYKGRKSLRENLKNQIQKVTAAPLGQKPLHRRTEIVTNTAEGTVAQFVRFALVVLARFLVREGNPKSASFGISNEFSNQSLSNGKLTETTFNKDYWRKPKKPVVFLSKTRHAKTIFTNGKRLWSFMAEMSTFLQNPPPNVFPFGNRTVTADVDNNKDLPIDLPAINLHFSLRFFQ
ncbi:hypothetical protein ACTXT7_004190 [Hymenolepis weldensis]